ncbi:MAG: hypothetical protein N2316_01940 [Spirochaetes bacterium]|nr:hypothetical protein [Spirochaetota bacterium]
MKVVHVLKKIESIDEDIRELRKLEKSLAKNKSFTTPIYMSIEKQINILLGEKIKLMELKIANPPKEFAEEVEAETPLIGFQEEKKSTNEKKQKDLQLKEKKVKQRGKVEKEKEISEESIPLVTQDFIDQKMKTIEESIKKEKEEPEGGDVHIKLLDIALEKGSISKNDIENEKKKVRFFKDNFPGGEY